MKVTFKAHGPSVDAIILGLAKSGIPVCANVAELRAIGIGDSYITADFPPLTPNAMPVANAEMALYGESKAAAPTVSEEESTVF